MRAYSQTTGAWIRGIIENDYGADLSGVQWVTFEDGHLAEFKDPPGVIRAGSGTDMTEMLLAGELDAAIYGAAIPDDPRLQSVIPGSGCGGDGLVRQTQPGAGQSHGGRARNPGAVQPESGCRVVPAAGSRKGSGWYSASRFGAIWQSNRRGIELLISYCVQQGLIPRRLDVDELW